MERVASKEQLAFRESLLDAGILHKSSAKGVYGKGTGVRRGVSRASIAS